MGQIIALKCNNCDNLITLKAGQGISDNNLDRVIETFGADDQLKIRDELGKHTSPLWNFTHMVASCKVDHNIVSLPVFTITENGSDRVIATKCDCGGEHELFDQKMLERDELTLSCPRCGQEMTYSVTGYWD